MASLTRTLTILLFSLLQFCDADSYHLSCMSIDCRSCQNNAHRCCSSQHQGQSRSLQSMANWRFGSVFRNSIPPPRPYKVPTFEEIFEKDHSSDIQESQSPNQFVLNLNSQNSKSTNQASSSHQQSKNMFKFSNFLTEHNRNSLKSPIVSETLSKLSKKDLLDEAFFESTTSKKVSEEDLRKKKLLEMAKEKLINKQKKKDQMIKAQQKQENYMKMMAHQAKEPRSQDLDNFFLKSERFE